MFASQEPLAPAPKGDEPKVPPWNAPPPKLGVSPTLPTPPSWPSAGVNPGLVAPMPNWEPPVANPPMPLTPNPNPAVPTPSP